MTICLADGGDHYTVMSQKWGLVGSGSSINASALRTGAAGFIISGSPSGKQVQATQEHATFILQTAARRNALGTLEWHFRSDGLATIHVTVQATATGEIKVFRGTIGGTQLGATVSAGTIPGATYLSVEIKVTLSDSVGAVAVRVNGAQVVAITGADTKNGGTKTVLDGFSLSAQGGVSEFDDIILLNGAGANNNDFIGDVKIETLFPAGAGSTTGLTPSSAVANYTTVDDAAPNTTDYNSSVTDDTYDTYAFSNLATVVGTIFGVVVHAYAAKSDAGVKGGAIVVRSGDVDYERTDNALGTGYQYYREIIEIDPATSAAWTVAAVNSLEAGFKVKAS